MEVPVFRHEAQTLHVPKTVSLGLTGLPFASSPDLPFWSRACALVLFAHSGEHGLLRFRLSMFLTLQAPFAAGRGRNEKLGFRPWALVRSCSARAFCLKNTHPRLGLHAACRAPRKWNGLVYCRTLSMRTEVTQMMLAQCFITLGLGLCVCVCVCGVYCPRLWTSHSQALHVTHIVSHFVECALQCKSTCMVHLGRVSPAGDHTVLACM